MIRKSLKQNNFKNMNKITKIIYISSLAGTLAFSGFTPVFAEQGKTSTAARGTKIEARMAIAKKRAAEEISRRINALTALKNRISEAKKISDSVKSSISSTVDNEISKLNTLKAKIDADTDLATLKGDIKSIKDSYRIFALIIPQGRIIAAADKINTIADYLTTISSKLQLRIDEAKAAGKDTSAMEKLLTDFNSKLDDAKKQAKSASDIVSALTPDNGDKAKFDANKRELKKAKEDLKGGRRDLKIARDDAHEITKLLKKLGLGKNSSASSTAPRNQ